MTTHSQTTADRRPWYREGWMLFVFSFPALSVVLGLAMLMLSLTTNNALVVDDYYKQGKAINQTLGRDQYAKQHNLSAFIEPGVDGVSIDLQGHPGFELPDAIQVKWVHITLDLHDGTLELLRDGQSNRYHAHWHLENDTSRFGRPYKDIQDMQYRVHIESDDKQWRLTGETGPLLTVQHIRTDT